MQKISMPFARLAIFVIYFWFGFLKVVGESPASPMVKALFNQTTAKMFPSISFEQFIIIFGLFEMIIGIIFLIPKFERMALFLLSIHLFTTALPLFMMKEMIWTKSWVPTLEGQYIIKNLAIVGLAFFVYVRK